MASEFIRHILGYLIGGMLFLLGIPYGMYQASQSWGGFFHLQLLPIMELRIAIGVIIVIVGFAFAIWSLVVQNQIGQGGPLEALNMEISPKTKQLVISGPYKYSRNPMLFGTCMYYYALAFFFNSMAVLILAVLFMTFMLVFVKLTEEKRLLKEFGNDYIAYRKKVSMFIPWPPK